MSVLNPWVLWALPLITVPILLHLIFSRPSRPFVFSYIGWLMEAYQSTMPRKKLRDLIILATRTLLLLFLILFFARPVVRQGKIFHSKDGDECVVILLDVSASMSGVVLGRPVLDMAKEKTIALLRKLPPTVKVGFVSFSNRVESEMAPSAERGRVISRIQEAKVSPRSTDILPALELSGKMLENQTASNQTILIVGDLAAHGWGTAVRSDGRWVGYDPGITIACWEIAGDLENASICDGFARLAEDGALSGYFDVRWSQLKIGDLSWSLNMNGKVVDQGRAKIGNGLEIRIPFTVKLPAGGFYSGKLELDEDPFLFDNTFHIAGRIGKGFKLLIVEGKRSQVPADAESYYLKMALESPRDPRLESVQIISADNFNSSLLEEFSLVVLANVGQADLPNEDILNWVARGGALFLSAGDKWGVSGAPGNFVKITHLNDNQQNLIVPKEDARFLRQLSSIKEFEWNEVRVTRYFSLQAPSPFRPIVEMSNGEPFIAHMTLGRGQVVALLTTLDRTWTNFPTKPVFSPLMREILAALADPMADQRSLMGYVGDVMEFATPAGLNRVTVVNPNGVSSGVRLERKNVVQWSETSEPGLYEVLTDKRSDDFAFAINIRNTKDEGDPSRITYRELKKAFPQSPLHFVRYSADNLKTVVSILEGREISTLLIILIFLLFCVETLLSWPRGVR